MTMEAVQQIDDLSVLIAQPTSLRELDIPSGMVVDLIMRILFQEGDVALSRISNIIKLDPQLLDAIVTGLQRVHLVEVACAGQIGRLSYSYRLSDAGRSRASEAMERSQYMGPAPVSVEKYVRGIQLQTMEPLTLTRAKFQ